MKTSLNKRHYNFFTINEMIVIISNEWKNVCECDIMLTKRFNDFENLRMRWINQNYTTYMSLHYVLLFAHDELNFHWRLILQAMSRTCENLRLSQRIFYQYHLHTRADVFFILHRAARLWQQYLIDAYVNCDLNKQIWLYKNQKFIRADLHNNLVDILQSNQVNVELLKKKFILSLSYTSELCYMQQLFQDNMTIVNFFDWFFMFITFTANSNWNKIKNELYTK